MIARLHAVAGQAEYVADSHRGAAQNIALDRDAVLVAAGDLHDGRITDARQERANRETRHVAVRAAAVGRVDRIDIAVENSCPFVHVLRVGGIRRREFGGDRKTARAQHPFEPSRGGMAGQDGQRIAGDRFVLESHGVPLGVPAGEPVADPVVTPFGPLPFSAFSRTTRNHDERPWER